MRFLILEFDAGFFFVKSNSLELFTHEEILPCFGLVLAHNYLWLYVI